MPFTCIFLRPFQECASSTRTIDLDSQISVPITTLCGKTPLCESNDTYRFTNHVSDFGRATSCVCCQSDRLLDSTLKTQSPDSTGQQH
jgi:hypothetical protein